MGQIRMVDVNGRHHATVYMRARAAMIHLGALRKIWRDIKY